MKTVLSQRADAQSDQKLVHEIVKIAHDLQLIHEEACSLTSIETSSSRGLGKSTPQREPTEEMEPDFTTPGFNLSLISFETSNSLINSLVYLIEKYV